MTGAPTLIKTRVAFASRAFSPRAFRGEKVPKADEGGEAEVAITK
jgi:hypothetical protein